MVMTKEEKRDYDKIYRQKNRQKRKEYLQNNKQKIADRTKKYNEKNKQKIADTKKIYRQNNKQKIKEYQQSPNRKKSYRISKWKERGIITDDYDYWYELYIEQNHCWHCESEFINSLDRHLDHDHQINDKENIRGILCRTCNLKDIYK